MVYEVTACVRKNDGGRRFVSYELYAETMSAAIEDARDIFGRKLVYAVAKEIGQ